MLSSHRKPKSEENEELQRDITSQSRTRKVQQNTSRYLLSHDLPPLSRAD